MGIGSNAATVTNAATNITATSATLNATAVGYGYDNPENFGGGGFDVFCSFEYGTSTSYGNGVDCGRYWPQPGNYTFSAGVSGLTPKTTYHFRGVTYTDLCGTKYGGDVSFTTTGVVPTVNLSEPSNKTNTSITLNGVVNANNESTTVTFNYGTTTSYGNNVTASSVNGTANTSVSANLSGLVQGTTYHYRITAINGTGTTYSSDGTFILGGAIPAVVFFY